MTVLGASQRRVLTTSMLTVALALGAISPVAAAAPNYRPDGQIRQPCDPYWTDCRPEWLGNDIYNTNAAGQTAEAYDQQGVSYDGPVLFRIRIQNDGARSDRFRVSASGSTSGYRVKFFKGTTNITAAVEAGTYKTPKLAPRATYNLRARVVLLSDAVHGDEAVRLVTLTSIGNPSKKDAVKFWRGFFTCGC